MSGIEQRLARFAPPGAPASLRSRVLADLATAEWAEAPAWWLDRLWLDRRWRFSGLLAGLALVAAQLLLLPTPVPEARTADRAGARPLSPPITLDSRRAVGSSWGELTFGRGAFARR